MKNPILNSISLWFQRTFSDPATVSLFMTLLLGVLLIEFAGNVLLPVFLSVVIAYLLRAPIRWIKRLRCPHILAVIIVYLLFLGLVLYFIFGLLPMLTRQLINLVNALPGAFTSSQRWVNDLVQQYPRLFSLIQFQHIADFFKSEMGKLGQIILQLSLASIPGLIQVVLYFVLVPILVFFFLKDGELIMAWLGRYMPSNRSLVSKVWSDVNVKIGAYVRGRVVEIIIVGTVTSIAFALLGLQYSVLLGALVGLSVLIPYVGAVVVTIPVVIVALMEWGFTSQFMYLLITYGIIAALDGNLLAPLLFAETMDLHPIVIIIAVVFFGALWGFWGVFFAIPLATLVDAVLRAWPRESRQEIGV